jgi:LysM repeat protein
MGTSNQHTSKIINVLLVIGLCVWFILNPATSQVIYAQDQPPSPYDLIAAVNALRTSHGMPPYHADPLLMLSAQMQAEYVASQYPGAVNGHVGPGGTNADARAAAVGFPDAPGLDIIENWAAMPLGMSFQEIFSTVWADALHQKTMLLPQGQLVGAGVALAGNNVIFILDVAAYFGDYGLTPQPTTALNSMGIVVSEYVAPVVIATPAADGSITHTVQSGQSLWSIATAYGVTIQSIRELNNIRLSDTIYIGQKLLVHPPGAVTPSPAALTPSPSFQDVQLPVNTLQPEKTIPTTIPAHSKVNLSLDQNGFFLFLFILVCVGVILIVIGSRRAVG